MSINKEIEFNTIVNDILKNEDFIELKYEIHHGITRLDHSLNVAHLAYNIAKKLKVKEYREITRAALLHDFFKSCEVPEKSFVKHPVVAAKNAKQEFNINAMQENIIIAHMFPLSVTIPKSIGGWIVTTADKIVAIKEVAKYKIPLTVGAVMLFIFNFLCIQR